MNRGKRFGAAVFCALLLGTLPAESVKVTNGRLHLVLHDQTGTFSIYYLAEPEKVRYVPLLTDLNQSRTTSFFLRIGDRQIKLQNNVSLPVSAEFAPPGGRIIWHVGKEAIVTGEFELISSQATNLADTLCITMTVQNLGEDDTFALRGVFDTWLGESSGIHFTSALRDRISAETELLNPAGEKWLRSAGQNASVQFLFTGGDLSVPQTVVIANRERLTDANWKLAVQSGRNFNSAYSINDSAVGIYWPAKRLAKGQKMTVRMYLSVDQNVALGRLGTPAAIDFTAAQGAVPQLPVKDALPRVLPAPGDSISEGSVSSTDGVVVDGHLITDNKLNMEYVNMLLKRIQELSASPSQASHEEIVWLNAELDIILDILRKQ